MWPLQSFHFLIKMDRLDLTPILKIVLKAPTNLNIRIKFFKVCQESADLPRLG